MSTENARNLANVAADKLTSLREEQEAADALPSTPARERIMLDARDEAASALERLAGAPGFVDPAHLAEDKRNAPPPARMQAKVIRDGLPTGRDSAALKRWATAWRAFAEAA